MKLCPPAPVAVDVEPVNLPLLLLKKSNQVKPFFTLMFQFVCQANQTICTLIYVNLYDNKTIFTLVCVNLYKIKQFAHSYINFQFVCQFPEEYVVETMPPCMGLSWSPKSSFQATRESKTGF